MLCNLGYNSFWYELNRNLSCVSYLPRHGSQYDRWHDTEEDQAFWNEAEVSHPPGGHDLIETPATGSLSPPGPLTLTQLGVEAPYCDQQNYVADGPEKAKEAEARDHQIPQLQVAKLCEAREKDH